MLPRIAAAVLFLSDHSSGSDELLAAVLLHLCPRRHLSRVKGNAATLLDIFSPPLVS